MHTHVLMASIGSTDIMTFDSRPLILHYWWCHYRTWEHEHAFSDRVQQTIPFSYRQLFETEFSIAVFFLDRIQSRFKHYISFYFSFSIQHPPLCKISHETGLWRVLASCHDKSWWASRKHGWENHSLVTLASQDRQYEAHNWPRSVTNYSRGQQTSPRQRYVFTFVIIIIIIIF